MFPRNHENYSWILKNHKNGPNWKWLSEFLSNIIPTNSIWKDLVYIFQKVKKQKWFLTISIVCSVHWIVKISTSTKLRKNGLYPFFYPSPVDATNNRNCRKSMLLFQNVCLLVNFIDFLSKIRATNVKMHAQQENFDFHVKIKFWVVTKYMFGTLRKQHSNRVSEILSIMCTNSSSCEYFSQQIPHILLQNPLISKLNSLKSMANHDINPILSDDISTTNRN